MYFGFNFHTRESQPPVNLLIQLDFCTVVHKRFNLNLNWIYLLSGEQNLNFVQLFCAILIISMTSLLSTGRIVVSILSIGIKKALDFYVVIHLVFSVFTCTVIILVCVNGVQEWSYVATAVIISFVYSGVCYTGNLVEFYVLYLKITLDSKWVEKDQERVLIFGPKCKKKK